MNISQIPSGLAKNTCALAVCGGIGEYGARAMSLGQPGLGAALGGTALLVNKVVGTVFDKLIQAPALVESDSSYKYVKLSTYALAYTLSKVVVVAATIALSSVVANSLGLTAAAMSVNSLSTLKNFSTIFEWGFYAGVSKGIASSILNNMRNESRSSSLYNESFVDEYDADLEDNLESDCRDQYRCASPRRQGERQCQSFVPPPPPIPDPILPTLRSRSRVLQRDFVPQGSPLGRLFLRTETEVERARVNSGHLRYRFVEKSIPEVSLDETRMKNLIQEKAREQGIEIPKYTDHLLGALSPFSAERGGPQYDSLSRVYKSMLKRIVHHLDSEINKAERNRDFEKLLEINDLWVTTLQHFEAGTGDCNDPIGEQIQQMYNVLFSDEQVIVNSFEGKIHLECRKLRDELFREACDEVMRNTPGRVYDLATGYEFYKRELGNSLNLTPSPGTHFPGYCRRGGYGDITYRVRQSFERKYTVNRIIAHMQSTVRGGKDRFGFGDIVRWLVDKTGADRNTVQDAILGGMDKETYMYRSEKPTKEAWATILGHLSSPIVR